MKKYKSLTNSMRHVCLINKDFLSKSNSTTKLTNSSFIAKDSGRNCHGHTTVYTKSNRKKRFYRLIDFKRIIFDIPAKIYTNEYDPNRSTFISLIVYKNNLCTYILGINGVTIGATIYNYSLNRFPRIYKKGDSDFLCKLPIGSIIHNIEYLPSHGSIYIRSAGTYGKLLRKNVKYNLILIELPSKYIFYASPYSKATLGVLNNSMHHLRKIGKAGRNRWLGCKPNVRGVAMNPVDHPHGGGEGKRSSDAHKKSPWGKINRWYNSKMLKRLV